MRSLPFRCCPDLVCLPAKLLLVLASTIILDSESHETHDHTLLPDGSVSLQNSTQCVQISLSSSCLVTI
jgi:hypothetical protein